MNSIILIACFLAQSEDDPLSISQGKGMRGNGFVDMVMKEDLVRVYGNTK